jgi:hypothetical protein
MEAHADFSNCAVNLRAVCVDSLIRDEWKEGADWRDRIGATEDSHEPV